MMSELIERLRYRFQLWWREQREDWIGPQGTHLIPEDYRQPRQPNPAFEELVRRREPIWSPVIRSIGVYFGIIIILAQIGRLIGAFLPTARFAVFVVFVVLACVWTLMSLTFTVNLYRAKKRLQSHGDESSNEALQPTGGRCNKKVEG
jgi:uncharacterized membrane protein (DUF485 family)